MNSIITTDLKDEKKKVNSILDLFLDCHRNHDMNLLSGIYVHDQDMINFGSDADEYFVGWEALKKSFVKQFNSFESTEVKYRNRAIRLHDSGLVAWYSEILDFNIIVKGQRIILNGFRHTGILEKRNDSWLIVQFHYSVPVQGQAVEY